MNAPICERCNAAPAAQDGLCVLCLAIIVADPQFTATPAELFEDHFVCSSIESGQQLQLEVAA